MYEIFSICTNNILYRYPESQMDDGGPPWGDAPPGLRARSSITGLQGRCLPLSNVAGEQSLADVAPVAPSARYTPSSVCRSVPYLQDSEIPSTNKEDDTDYAVVIHR